MGDLPADIEQQLSSMTARDFSAFVARVRAPDSEEQIRTVASKAIQGDQLNAFMAIADPAKFIGDDGTVDAGRVNSYIGTLFGRTPSATPSPAGKRAGEGGAAEAARRFGAKQPEPPTAPVAGVHAGHTVQAPGGVQAELERRYGKRDR